MDATSLLPPANEVAEDLAQAANFMAQQVTKIEDVIVPGAENNKNSGGGPFPPPSAAATEGTLPSLSGAVEPGPGDEDMHYLPLDCIPEGGDADVDMEESGEALTLSLDEMAEDPNTQGGGAPKELVFVNLTERKEPAAGKPPRSHRHSSGHNHHYIIKFFLVDHTGREHLAAIGVDSGDSHYEYTNQPGFPTLHCHNKLEVKKWADSIIARSQDRAGFHTDVIKDEVPPEGTPWKMPPFISYSETKEELEDGRHKLQWFLLDNEGHKHLALTGEEKETRDGHYNYYTADFFKHCTPLEAKNQEEVKRWLDAMLIKPQQGAPVATTPVAGPAAAAAAAAGAPPMALRTAAQRAPRASQMLKFGAHVGVSSFRGTGGGRYSTPGSTGGRRGRGRGRGPGRPPRPSLPGSAGYGAAGAHSLLRQATGNLVRRGRGGWKLADPDRDARELIAAELKRWSQEEASRREFVKNETLAYMNDELPNSDANVLARVLPVLQEAAEAGPAGLPPPGKEGTVAQRKALVSTLAALREVAHLRATLELVAYPGLKSAVAALAEESSSGSAEVAGLANRVLQGWLRAAVANIAVLAEPRYASDPRPVLDNLIHDRNRFDSVVTAITHRALSKAPEHSMMLPSGGGAAGGVGLFTPGSEGGLAPAVHETPSMSTAGGDVMLEGEYSQGGFVEAASLQGEDGVGLGKNLAGGEVGAVHGAEQSGAGALNVGSSGNLDAAAGEHQGATDAQQQPAQAHQQQLPPVALQQGPVVGMQSRMDLQYAPSAALLEGPAAVGSDDGAQILPPFEQQLAKGGCEF